MKKSLFCVVLTLCILLPCLLCAVSAQSQSSEDVSIRIAYIPIDDRPVNVDRVQYLAQSANIELLMPDKDLYRTALDNMTPNSNGTTYGDREALVDWLKSVESSCDYYALSLDQLLSGGLVSSRWMSNEDLSLEYEIADYIIQLASRKKVVLFDTVVRLASTVGYMGYSSTEYSQLRKYGSVARKTLSGEQLTVDNIIAGYQYNASGSLIKSKLSSEAIEKYLASRARKLKLIDYILDNALDTIDYCIIGVDDSSNGTNIQTNEINYIRAKAGDKASVFAATDELGLLSVTRIITSINGALSADVTYYGGSENQIADGYDFESLEATVTAHLATLNCSLSSDAKLQILCFTNGGSASDAKRLLEQAQANIEQNIPTIIINPTLSAGNKNLQNALSSSDLPLGMILGYSNWNTAGNAIGIAVSNGIARYSYLTTTESATESSNDGFLKTLAFSYLKDISYKSFNVPTSSSSSDFPSYSYFVNQLNSSAILTSLKEYRASAHGSVSVSDYYYPWNRTFEMAFTISVDNSHITPQIYSVGDVNLDGSITAKDYLMVKRHILGSFTLSNEQLNYADVNEDGNVTAIDYLMLKRIVLGTYSRS